MKTVYIPAGATYNYETLVTDDVIVHGHLHVANGLKAKHISGRGFITAGEVSADIVDVTELECGTVICRRVLAQRVSCNEAMISESAAVSRFFSANYVKAPSLTVAVSEIGEADAEGNRAFDAEAARHAPDAAFFKASYILAAPDGKPSAGTV